MQRKAVREGRARQPDPPDNPFVHAVMETRSINHFLESNYRVEDILRMSTARREILVIMASEYFRSLAKDA